jgi:transcriptional regulator with XRE-family HTH domain
MVDLKRFRKEKNISQKDLQDLLGLSQSYISSLENRVKPITDDIYKKLVDKYDGDILPYVIKDGDISNISESAVNYNRKQIQKVTGVPYYDIDVTGSIVSSFSDIREVPEFYIDYKPFNDCTAYFTMYGDSMYPRYCAGETIAVKEVRNQDVILWGETYLVITNSECNDLRTVKRVYQAEDKNYIILRASNPDYKGDTLIKKDCILGMYLVKGKIHRDQI